MKNTHRVIYTAANAQQAHLLANALVERGIFAYVTNDMLQGAAGDLPFGLPTLPRVVVHEDDATEARQLAVEFDRSTVTAPAASGLQFGLNVLFYLVTWAGIFFATNRLLDNRGARGTVNTLLASAFLVVTFLLISRRVARRNREYSSNLVAGDWHDAPVGESDQRGGEPDDEFDDFDDEDELPYVWPACPHCGRPRLTTCPVCETSGSDFAPAYLPTEEEIAESATAEGLGYHVLCPTCDEPFRAEFPSECEWCGHRFHDGRPARAARSTVTSPFADMNERAWIVLGGLLTTVVAVIGLFVWLVSRR